MPEKHAFLSASGAHIWLNCPAAPRASEHVEDTGSEYAREGTLAHSIAELKVRKQFVEPMGERTFKTRLNKLKKNELYQAEMLAYTDAYLEFVKGVSYGFSSRPYIVVEQELDLSKYVPESFGTADCVIVGGDVLHIIDFKYGKGVPVHAEGNPQIRLYALGALTRYIMIYPIKTVRMTIFQPRLENTDTAEMTAADLLAWGESIKPKAQAAFMGVGGFHAGEHCQFCKIRATCRERAEKAMSAVKTIEEHADQKGPELSLEEVGALLTECTAANVVKWVKQLQDYALTKTLDGENVPGWKAVAGRTSRAFKDFNEVEKILVDKGYKRAVLYKREPETLTAIEHLLGKPTFSDLLAEQVIKSNGKPALVPESDRREPYHAESAAADFQNVPVEPISDETKPDQTKSDETTKGSI